MFKVGDIVQLKSGGPKMTVHRIVGQGEGSTQIKMQDKVLFLSGFIDGDLICQWFVRTKLESRTFKADMCVKIDN
jgi:uncharacterized protein YodC (DUF2158 family)